MFEHFFTCSHQFERIFTKICILKKLVWSNACPLTLHCWLRLQRKELEIGSFAALLPFTLQSAICNLQSAICNVSDCCLNLFVCFHWHFNDLPHHSPTVKFCTRIHRSVSPIAQRCTAVFCFRCLLAAIHCISHKTTQ